MKPLWIALLSLSITFVQTGCSQDSKAKKRIFGQIEVDEIDVGSRLPARVRRILVKPGQKVKAGDILVEFEDDVMSAKRKQALAVILAAESRRDLSKDAVRSEEKEQLRAAVDAAKSQLDFAKVSWERASSVFKEGAISQQALDEINFKHRAAKEQFNAARAKQIMANNGARREDRVAAEALVEQAKNALAEVDAYQKDLNLVSPIQGEVFQILNHEGELVPTGYPVVTLLKISDSWLSFQIPETQMQNFPLGKTVPFLVPALQNKQMSGQISYISPMANFATRTSTQDRASFDLKTFELRISLANMDEVLRPGMTAVIEPDESVRK